MARDQRVVELLYKSFATRRPITTVLVALFFSGRTSNVNGSNRGHRVEGQAGAYINRTAAAARRGQ